MQNPLWSYIFKGKPDERSLNELLSAIPIFEGLSKSNVRQVARVLHERQYAKGETVFNESEPGAGLYIIRSGRVEILKTIERSAPIRLAEFVEGNFFGELALIDELPRTAAAVAVEPTSLLAFPKPDLDRLIERQPQLAVRVLFNLSKIIAQRLIEANRQFESLRPSEAAEA